REPKVNGSRARLLPLKPPALQRSRIGTMFDIIREIFAADTFSYSVALMLALVAGVLIASATSSSNLGAIYAPGIALGALTGIYAARVTHFAPTNDEYVDVVLAAAAGTIAGLGAMMLLTMLAHAITRVRKPLTVATRNPYRS